MSALNIVLRPSLHKEISGDGQTKIKHFKLNVTHFHLISNLSILLKYWYGQRELSAFT